MKRPVLRQSCAPDPDPAKVQAALAVWRAALTRHLLDHSTQPDEKEYQDVKNIFATTELSGPPYRIEY